MGGSSDSGVELAFAIAHEVGNHLGGIRLQAHLLDDELGAREMAEASVLIDALAGRSGPLLALLRPLLSDDWRRAGGDSWAGVLGRVAQQIEDEGTRGVRFEVVGVLETEVAAPDFEAPGQDDEKAATRLGLAEEYLAVEEAFLRGQAGGVMEQDVGVLAGFLRAVFIDGHHLEGHNFCCCRTVVK